MSENIKGWDDHEIEFLKSRILYCLENGLPLSKAFQSTAEKTNRNQSSVRNFYYTYLRKNMVKDQTSNITRRKSTSFDTFSDNEIYRIVKYIIMGISSGKSVRKCAYELSNGDTKLMLRYQNKYRSVVQRHRTMVEKILRNLEEEGFNYISPYKNENSEVTNAFKKLNDDIHLSDYIKNVNVLYDNALINEKMRKNLICTKAMLEGERTKMQKAKMMCEYYFEKLRDLTKENITYDVKE